jgi:hypothetical protein
MTILLPCGLAITSLSILMIDAKKKLTQWRLGGRQELRFAWMLGLFVFDLLLQLIEKLFKPLQVSRLSHQCFCV